MRDICTLLDRLKLEICRALTVYVNTVCKWTDTTTVLQLLNYKGNYAIFIANQVCKILGHTSVDEWSHGASSDNPADAGAPCMSAEVLQPSSWVSSPESLRSKQFPFDPSTEVVANIKPGIIKKENDKTNISLAASLGKSTKEPPPQLIFFDMFSSRRKLLWRTACVLGC